MGLTKAEKNAYEARVAKWDAARDAGHATDEAEIAAHRAVEAEAALRAGRALAAQILYSAGGSARTDEAAVLARYFVAVNGLGL